MKQTTRNRTKEFAELCAKDADILHRIVIKDAKGDISSVLEGSYYDIYKVALRRFQNAANSAVLGPASPATWHHERAVHMRGARP
jgi:hypothetical protein